MLNPRENNPNLTPDEEALVWRIHDFIEEHERRTGGYCGLGALMVVGILGTENYTLMDGNGHWWAVNKTTLARLDPTADQFECADLINGDWVVVASGEVGAQLYYRRGKETNWDYIMDHYRHEWDTYGLPFVTAERLKLNHKQFNQKRGAA